MSWTLKPFNQLSGAEWATRVDDAIRRIATDEGTPDPITFLDACGVTGVELSGFERDWTQRYLPAILSWRANGPVAETAAQERYSEAYRRNAAYLEYQGNPSVPMQTGDVFVVAGEYQNPVRVDVVYGTGTARQGTARQTARKKQGRATPAPLGGPRAYFND